MRFLRYLGLTILFMALVALLTGGCKNPDNIPASGFSLTPSPVKVVFTDPQFRVEGSGKDGASDPYTRQTMQSVGLTMLEMADLMAYIDSAKSTIDICSTRINNQGMVIRLVSIANRGVKVRIVTEKGFFNDPNSIYMIQELIDAGVLIRTDEDDINRQMHERYWIIDNHIVLTGSADMLDTSFSRSANNTLIIDTPLSSGLNASSDVSEIKSVTDAFFFDFTQMFDRGKFGKEKEVMLKHTFKIGVDVKIYFGPNDGLRTMIIDQLNNINEYLFYAINQATDGAIINLINTLVTSGRYAIAGVYDGPSATYAMPNGVAYDFPTRNGMNDKFMVLDVPTTFEDFEYFTAASSNDPVVLSGSCNWTTAGLDLNDETLVEVHDLTLAFQYAVCEANALMAAANNTGVVYGRVRSASNNIGLESTLTIATRRASEAFPGVAEPIEVQSGGTEGFYGVYITTGDLYMLQITAAPENHLTPEPKFQYGDTFLLLPGASYEGNFYPKLAPTGTGTGGT